MPAAVYNGVRVQSSHCLSDGIFNVEQCGQAQAEPVRPEEEKPLDQDDNTGELGSTDMVPVLEGDSVSTVLYIPAPPPPHPPPLACAVGGAGIC